MKKLAKSSLKAIATGEISQSLSSETASQLCYSAKFHSLSVKCQSTVLFSKVTSIAKIIIKVYMLKVVCNGKMTWTYILA